MSTGPSSDGSVLSFPVYQAGGLGEWIEGTLSPKVPISGQLASSGALAPCSCCGWESGVNLLEWELFGVKVPI